MENDKDRGTNILSIALQDGFEGEPVIVYINDKEVYQQPEVKTDYRISLADSFKVPISDRLVTIKVSLPNKQIAESVKVNPYATPYVGISCLDSTLRFKCSDSPFGYL